MRKKHSVAQSAIFKTSEGNRWFARNREALLTPRRFWPLELLSRRSIKPARVLEIGASFGWGLELFRKKYGARCVAVEPSRQAVAFGRKRFPRITFRRGLMHTLPVKRGEMFDLVIVAFVFHWVDRPLLLASVSELDRVLADGGHLIIADFLPDQPAKRPYHHLPGKSVFTYKQDYAAFFTASALYREEERVTFHHQTLKSGGRIPGNERAVCVLLKKQPVYRDEV
jgi:SAM-dependent methyltransferase